jgi:hypothetical protein
MRLTGLLCAIGVTAVGPVAVRATPVLRAADVRVTFQSPTACTVELGVTIDDAVQVEHRVETAEGGRVDLMEISGATPAGPPTDIGRTRALTVRPERASYTLRYEVQLPAARAGRCPLWIPTVAADVRAATVRVTTKLPGGARAAGTMPTFRWNGDEGTATIGHLPAFVRVPYAMPGETAPWNIGRLMDIFSIATLVVATLAWARRQRRSRDLSPSPGLRRASKTSGPPAFAKATAGKQDLEGLDD